ncbi:MAG: DUF423 domain-containing protein [bacterium]|jgi:uncharacterized membrane protein YgdD (TMEM256/DUF423 family)
MHKNRIFVKLAGFLGALTVMIGAFGAHYLKQYLTPDQMLTYQTAVSYQFYHILALLATGILYKRYRTQSMNRSGQFFIWGIVLFSGSLYASIFLTVIGKGGLGMFAFVTPLGGLLLIIGWLLLVAGVPGSLLAPDEEE